MTEAAESVVLDYFTLARDEPDGRGPGGDRQRPQGRRGRVQGPLPGGRAEAGRPHPAAAGTLAALDRAIAAGAVTAPEAGGRRVAVLTRGEKWGEFVVARDGQVVFARPLPATALNSEPTLLGELRRNLAVYNGQNPQQPVEALYVAEAGRARRVERPRPGRAAGPGAGVRPAGRASSTTRRRTPAGTSPRWPGSSHLRPRARPLPIDFVAPREPAAAQIDRPPQAGRAGAAVLALLVLGGLGVRVRQVSRTSRSELAG